MIIFDDIFSACYFEILLTKEVILYILKMWTIHFLQISVKIIADNKILTVHFLIFIKAKDEDEYQSTFHMFSGFYFTYLQIKSRL